MCLMVELPSLSESCADETRRRILLLLLAQGELCVCDLFGVLDLPQPKVSRHLSVLRDADLVASRKRGTWVYYRLNPEMPLWAVQILGAMADGAARSEPYQSDRQRLKSSCTAAVCCA
jgi:ArsR family transcriptional regulator